MKSLLRRSVSLDNNNSSNASKHLSTSSSSSSASSAAKSLIQLTKSMTRKSSSFDDLCYEKKIKDIPRSSSGSHSSNDNDDKRKAVALPSIEDGFNFSQIQVSEGGIITVNTDAVFFKEVESSIEKEKETRARKPLIRRSKSKNSIASLDSIDEEKELENENYIKEHKVRITSIIVPHDGDRCAKFVASQLHQDIVEHPCFTSISNMPQVFRDAFVSTDDSFLRSISNEGEDESGCSVITTIVTVNNAICVAHIGDVRGVIRGTDGTVAELASGHVIGKSPKEKVRLQRMGVQVSNDQKIFGKLIYSRAFGHKSFKNAQQGGLICLPNVIQIQMHFNSVQKYEPAVEQSTDNTTVSLSTENSIQSLQTPHKGNKSKREDILLVFGSSSAWNQTTDKKLCNAIVSSLPQEDDNAVIETIEKNVFPKPSRSLFGKRSDSGNENSQKGICVVSWSRYI